MTVQLMLTCLCDALYGEVGIATVAVLEHCGVKVLFPEEQTCCGQPPFNSGDWETARTVSKRCLDCFDPEVPIVVPSASCAAMVRHGYSLMAVGDGDTSDSRVFELSEYLLDEVGIDRWPLHGNSIAQKRKVAFHQSCHGRMIGLGDRQRRLLALARGVEIVDVGQPEQCCGFGGAFAATHGSISEGIGLAKLRCLSESGAQLVASGDMGCLMHLEGLAKRHELDLRFVHYAQILAEGLA